MKHSFWKLIELLSKYTSENDLQSILIENKDLIDHAKQSPDGKYLALAVACEDRRVLTILDNRSNLPKKTFDCGSNNYIQRFEWLSNEKVAFTRCGQSANEAHINQTDRICVGMIGGEESSVVYGDRIEEIR